tara:strand:+ start:55 stop:471 length:417 start_codon:yes stop_codon:yes gene_type:complete
MVKISKTYVPNLKEKYMCEKHKAYFKKKLSDWKSEIIKSNNEALYNNSLDDNSTSADIVDQASSYTEKNVEMRAINRQIKLISKIDQALKKIKENTYGYCEETGEPIGIKRLIARPIATLCIAAQEKHEKEEKVYADL